MADFKSGIAATDLGSSFGLEAGRLDAGHLTVKPSRAAIMGADSKFDLSTFLTATSGDPIGALAHAKGIETKIGAPAHTGGSIQKPQEMSLIS